MSFLKHQKQSPEFLNNFLKYKRYIEYGAQTTADETYYDLKTLFRFVKLYLYDNEKVNTITKEEFRKIEIIDVTIDDLGQITSSNLNEYMYFLAVTLENDSRTRNRKLASTKRFYEYLEVNNLIVRNPTLNLDSATTKKRLPKYLNLKQSKQLLANTINSDARYKIRNYAITCIFLNCSLRLSELVGINLSDMKIDNSEQTLRIHGKGNKERIIYLNAATCEAINAYMKVRPKLGKDNPDYNALFISSRNKRISKRAVQTIIKDELNELIEAEGKDEDKKSYHTHTLRHTGATLLYEENDVNIFVLKKILGHESLEATQIYTHVSDKKLKDLMLKFNILDRKEQI
jgi:site-specific recombinase XerD